MFISQKTSPHAPAHFFAYNNSFDGFEDLTTCCSDLVDHSSKSDQMPTVSISSLHFDEASETSTESVSSETSWTPSETASSEDDHELFDSIDHKLSSHWEDRNEKVSFADLLHVLYSHDRRLSSNHTITLLRCQEKRFADSSCRP
jgi:hypothetical protein